MTIEEKAEEYCKERDGNLWDSVSGLQQDGFIANTNEAFNAVLEELRDWTKLVYASGHAEGVREGRASHKPQSGIYGKYIIGKTDGTPIDPKAFYFVLRLDTDPHARRAMAEYAKSVEKDNPKLCEDIIMTLQEMLPPPPVEREG